MIQPEPATPNVVKNLLDDYGTISYEAILAKEQTYIDTDCRETQDTHMLYECIMNSLTDEGRAKLNIDDDLYTVGTSQRMSGACLLKILIRESHLDSNATSSMIRFKLSNLDEYLSEIDNDINKFHKYVKVLIDNLHARGETTHDLLANLFKAYAACSDQTFVKYMSDVQTRWERRRSPYSKSTYAEGSPQIQDPEIEGPAGGPIRARREDYSARISPDRHEEENEAVQGRKEKGQRGWKK